MTESTQRVQTLVKAVLLIIDRQLDTTLATTCYLV